MHQVDTTRHTSAGIGYTSWARTRQDRTTDPEAARRPFRSPYLAHSDQISDVLLHALKRSLTRKTTVKVFEALWEYREINRRRQGAEESYPNAETEFVALIARLGGKRPTPAAAAKRQPLPKIELRGT
jgi:hypothetical protein